MTMYNDRSETSNLVAIDISKNRNDILIQELRKKRYKMSITNERVDHDRFIKLLSSFQDKVEVGFEATGNYHRALAWRLVSAGLNVHLISSVALARTREALHNSWDKNDPKDAQVILYMLATGNVRRYQYPLHAGTNDWQEMSKTHYAISQDKTEVLHRLQTHYLPLYFPEIDRFRHSSRADWFFKFLHEYPTPNTILALSRKQFIEAAWDLVGRKVHKSLVLSDIYDTAASSTGLPITESSSAMAMYRLVIT